MLGFDKFFFVDWWVSIQLQQSYILNSDKAKGAYYDVGSGYKGRPLTEDVLNGFGTGMRDEVETTLTFYLYKDFFPGDTAHGDLFLLWDDDGAWWFRPKVKYDVTNTFQVSLGCNFYWGNEDDYWGEWHDNDNIFVEIKKGF